MTPAGGRAICPPMKSSEADIVFVPGYKGSGPDHWQTRWERKLSTARRAAMGDWHKPVFEEWRDNLLAEVERARQPVVLVGHSVGSQVIVNAADRFAGRVAGAFLVAPPDVENAQIRPRHLMTFGPFRRDPLPFPSVTVASRNDPFCAFATAEAMAAAWGSLFIDAGASGHLNHESGHGPWPEGLLVFARFLARLAK
ncbi:MAG: alpha/beta hydrolase [Alphaproteobacteria bacterium]|nr:MAG: alpha/beta hydrolase [Alphaproteobacteria bacterium]